ncbi:hypothetical protein N7492_005550 [Penicillium capsulatum]|uniref:Uncharacterized protein n=1 Tax=Penicillium capsulatum TaxID=69766 RepID=A0A9W9IDL7_9EURO|nr:hypothetical protein N7492_005550 [Penicillium capsulatum]KAJ6135350.1 hypothetical protein N7512_000510 [Penicillium capsulatum]
MSYSSRGRGDHGGSDSRGGSRGRGGFDPRGGRGGGSYRGSSESRSRGGPGGSQGRGGGGRREPPAPPSVLLDGNLEVNPNVEPFEDKCLAVNKKDLKGGKGILALRPDFGTKGRKIMLRTNFYEMNINPDAVFYTYRVSLKPEKGLRRHIKTAFRNLMNMEVFKQLHAATDGASEIVTVARMPKVGELLVSGETPGEEEQRGTRNKDKKPMFKFTFTEGVVIRPAQLMQALRDCHVQEKVNNEDVAIRVLNILMSKHPYDDEGTVIAGKTRNKYFWIDDRKQSAYLGGGLECIRGFYSSMRLSAGRVLLNINVNHSAFFAPGPLAKLVAEFQMVFGNDLPLLNRYIRSLRVYNTHLPKVKDEYGKMTWRERSIWGLASPKDGSRLPSPPKIKELGAAPPDCKFFLEDPNDGRAGPPSGRYVTVVEYFKLKYGIVVKEMNRPCVNVGGHDKPSYLPLDVCLVVPGQITNGELGTSQRQAIIGFSCRRPPDNLLTIKSNGLKMIGSEKEGFFRRGLKVKPGLLVVPGRILNAPGLRYGRKIQVPKSGSWNLRDSKFCRGVTVTNWAALVIYTESKAPDVNQTHMPAVRALKNASEKLGLSLNMTGPEFPITPIKYNRFELRKNLDGLFTRAKERGFEFVLVFLPNTDERIFSEVKYAGDVKYGVLTHCCLSDKFLNGNEQYMANNAMKINLKLGGINQALEQPKSSRLIDEGKTMVVGLDVTHPSATDPPEFPSIACIVASVDKDLGQWPGEAQIQGKKVERIEKLHDMLANCLRRWEKRNRQLPENIIVYRDGVSEGQFEMVAQYEYDSLCKATAMMYRHRPAITIIVCGKRHNVRFFPTKMEDMDKTSNPINGTIVDRGITRPIFWDFYLQAQAPIQGSARPAHYVVLRDEIFTDKKINPEGKASDMVQELTHNICYLMGRCTRSVSYSTPAFLADRFCDRARRYVRAEMAKQMFLEDRAADQAGRRPDYRFHFEDNVVQIHPGIADRMVYI